MKKEKQNNLWKVLFILAIIVIIILSVILYNSKPQLKITRLEIPEYVEKGNEFSVYFGYKFNVPIDTATIQWRYRKECITILKDKSYYDVSHHIHKIGEKLNHFEDFKVLEDAPDWCLKDDNYFGISIYTEDGLGDSKYEDLKIVPEYTTYCNKCNKICEEK